MMKCYTVKFLKIYIIELKHNIFQIKFIEKSTNQYFELLIL